MQSFQLNLFQEPEIQINNEKLDTIVDVIRNRYGYTALVHASSIAEGGRAIARSTLVGGHASGITNLNEVKK